MPSQARAVRKMLKKSGNRLFEKCHWCECVCVWSQKIPKEDILDKWMDKGPGFKLKSGNINFKLKGQIFTFPIVTIDHVLEKSKGGTNNFDNLVLSCFKCNSSRSTPPNPDKISPNCLECGEPKPEGSKRKYCKSCQNVKAEFHMKQNGRWVFHLEMENQRQSRKQERLRDALRKAKNSY